MLAGLHAASRSYFVGSHVEAATFPVNQKPVNRGPGRRRRVPAGAADAPRSPLLGAL